MDELSNRTAEIDTFLRTVDLFYLKRFSISKPSLIFFVVKPFKDDGNNFNLILA